MPALKDTDRLIDAISSLKRAAFIENVNLGDDRWKNGECILYTDTKDSSDILLNLLAQAFGDHRPPLTQTYSDDELDIYAIRFPAPKNSCNLLAEQVEKMTQRLIAPDQTRRR